MRLANKVAIITGAASGIGRASAVLFSKEGAKVVVADIDDTGGKETVETIKTNGGEAIFVHTDVSESAQVKHLARVAVDTFGRIDILFNNAGISQSRADVEKIDELEWDRIFAVNIKGVFLGVKYVVPEMKKAGGGVVINTGSMSGVRPRLHIAAYASSKGAVNTFTKALAMEFATYKIRVNCINPVSTATPMEVRFRAQAKDPEEARKRMISTIPLGREAQPEDIAYGALYLACDESSMVTGVSLNIDGGRGI